MRRKKMQEAEDEKAMKKFCEGLKKRAKVKEGGSDGLRGKNQDAQIRALNYKDPEGKGGGHWSE